MRAPHLLLPGAAPAGFARLKQAIIERTGHFYYHDKDAALWERLARRLAATGMADCDAYLALLADGVAGEREWAALEAEVTIGETFFFRYAEQFAALRDHILPALLAANRAQRRLRVWSAGCATGAEPYSIAILLRRLLGAETPQWRLSILGTDLNGAFLQTARRAEYGAWALRAVPPAERSEDFIPAADGKRWTLRPEHRALVRFERQNLRALLDRAAPLTLGDFDLILCRNVLIYFHPETVQQLVRALGARLSAPGWLLLGHAEPSPAFTRFLRQVELPGTVAYRRPDVAAENSAVPGLPPSALAPPANWSPLLPSAAAAPSVAAPAPATPLPAPGPAAAEDAADALAEVRRLADGGETGRAWALCCAALAGAPMSAGLHFYGGLLAWTLGQPVEAENALRRAIYLDPGHVMAHYQLGLLLLHRGEPARAQRAIGNALGIARGLADAAPLREGDGLTAAAFRELARWQLRPGSP